MNTTHIARLYNIFTALRQIMQLQDKKYTQYMNIHFNLNWADKNTNLLALARCAPAFSSLIILCL